VKVVNCRNPLYASLDWIVGLDACVRIFGHFAEDYNIVGSDYIGLGLSVVLVLVLPIVVLVLALVLLSVVLVLVLLLKVVVLLTSLALIHYEAPRV